LNRGAHMARPVLGTVGRENLARANLENLENLENAETL